LFTLKFSKPLRSSSIISSATPMLRVVFGPIYSGQASPKHAGGVIDFERNYYGADFRWTGKELLSSGSQRHNNYAQNQ
jgi:hypothetical protein